MNRAFPFVGVSYAFATPSTCCYAFIEAISVDSFFEFDCWGLDSEIGGSFTSNDCDSAILNSDFDCLSIYCCCDVLFVFIDGNFNIDDDRCVNCDGLICTFTRIDSTFYRLRFVLDSWLLFDVGGICVSSSPSELESII